MAIEPICNKCEKELREFGALLFGPPDKKGRVEKLHICKKCYKELGKFLGS